MRPYLQKNNGFLLLETIVGVVILSVIVATTISMLQRKQSTNQYIDERLKSLTVASTLAFEYRLFNKKGSKSGKVDDLKYEQGIDDSINGNLVLKTEVFSPSGVIVFETYGH